MKYEYKTLQIRNIQKAFKAELNTIEFDETLRRYAKEGWEIDQAFPLPGAYGYSVYTIVILKRPQKEPTE